MTDPLHTRPASQGVINGVRIAMVARLVAGIPDRMASADERRIALKVQRVGEKMEREGYLPELRRRHMLDVIAREAVCVAPPESPDSRRCECGGLVDIGPLRFVDGVASVEARCTGCGKDHSKAEDVRQPGDTFKLPEVPDAQV